jgi:hypothetical protein
MNGDFVAAMPGQRKKWVRDVKTDSTHPAPGLFTQAPETIARQLASKRVSPKGLGSGMRMLTYYINRAGKNLTGAQRKRLEKAKQLLSIRVHAARRRKKKTKSS